MQSAPPFGLNSIMHCLVLQEESHFLSQNPSLHYHYNTVQELKALYVEALHPSPPEETSSHLAKKDEKGKKEKGGKEKKDSKAPKAQSITKEESAVKEVVSTGQGEKMVRIVRKC